jgi:hypothetical protein
MAAVLWVFNVLDGRKVFLEFLQMLIGGPGS